MKFMETFKLTFMCLAASFLTVSCTETTDLISYDYETNGIQFTTSSDIPQSRGLPISSANDMPNMGVFAYYTGNGNTNNWGAKGATATPNFMNNIQITSTGGVWSYDNPVYWPQAIDANVSFFAYSPHATATNGITMNVTIGIPSIDYTVPINCSDQPDLMVSALLQDRNKTNNGSSSVNFQMRHALTCIGFKASGNGEKIEKITVKGVKKSGRLSIATDGTPSWNLAGATNENFEAIVDDGVYLGSTAELVNTGGGYLMMVPQTLTSGATLSVELNSGRNFDFDLEGLTWGAGQFIISKTMVPLTKNQVRVNIGTKRLPAEPENQPDFIKKNTVIIEVADDNSLTVKPYDSEEMEVETVDVKVAHPGDNAYALYNNRLDPTTTTFCVCYKYRLKTGSWTEVREAIRLPVIVIE